MQQMKISDPKKEYEEDGIKMLEDKSQPFSAPTVHDKCIHEHATMLNEHVQSHQDLQNSVRKMIKYHDVDGMAFLSLHANNVMTDNENGSTSDEFKVKSLQMRWFKKHK